MVQDAASDPTGLIFVYQVSNNGPNVVPNLINNVDINGFNPGVISGTPASYGSITGLSFGLAPSASGNFNIVLIGTDNVTFQQIAGLQGVSDYLAIETDATAFDLDYSQAAGILATGGAFAAQAAPTPASPGLTLLLP